MNSLFLIGGGWQPDALACTYGRFVDAAMRDGYRRILLILAGEHGKERAQMLDKYIDAFAYLGVSESEISPLLLSAECPLSEKAVRQLRPTGIFVCGGLTPLYQQCLCVDTQWLTYLFAHRIPYCGFSAGAAIAAKRALVGGWRISEDERAYPILDEELAEELDFVEVRNGLGLVDYSIDVHGSQWGTLSRLMHAVDQGLVETGWAIDESTMLEIKDGHVQVFGLGQAYFVEKMEKGQVKVQIYREGAVIPSRREP